MVDVTAIPEYEIDPITKVLKRKVDATPAPKPLKLAPHAGTMSSRSQGLLGDEPGSWATKTDAEKAAYYAANPTMSNITQLGQQLFGYTTLGKLAGLLQDRFNPGFRETQALIARGINPTGMLNPVGQLGVYSQGYNSLLGLGYGRTDAQNLIADAINGRWGMQAPAPMETIDLATGQRTYDPGGSYGSSGYNPSSSSFYGGSNSNDGDGTGGYSLGGFYGGYGEGGD
jgi:hypothetical protein